MPMTPQQKQDFDEMQAAMDVVVKAAAVLISLHISTVFMLSNPLSYMPMSRQK